MNIFTKIRRFARGKPFSCKRVNQYLIDYMEGSMDDSTRVRFEAHLRNCRNCERFVEQYSETVSLVRSNGDIEVPDEVIDRTIDFLKNHYDEKA